MSDNLCEENCDDVSFEPFHDQVKLPTFTNHSSDGDDMMNAKYRAVFIAHDSKEEQEIMIEANNARAIAKLLGGNDNYLYDQIFTMPATTNKVKDGRQIGLCYIAQGESTPTNEFLSFNYPLKIGNALICAQDANGNATDLTHEDFHRFLKKLKNIMRITPLLFNVLTEDIFD